MNSKIDSTPATGLSSSVAMQHSAHTAPVWTEQGTRVSCAAFAQVAFGVRVTDLPGLPPRGAPV